MKKPLTSYRLWPDPSKGPWKIDLAWMFIDGRMECVGVDLRSYAVENFADIDFIDAQERCGTGPRAVTATMWREVPIASIIDEERGRRIKKVLSEGGSAAAKNYRQAAENFQQLAERWDGPGGLAEVARVYTEAWHRGEPPTKAVSAHLEISLSAAAKRVARAREPKVGLLPPTKAGRAEGKRLPSSPTDKSSSKRSATKGKNR